MLNEITKEQHLDQYKNYPETFKGGLEENPWYEGRVKPLFYEVPIGSKVLDIGCNNGEFMTMLKEKRKCHVFGVDLSEAAVKTARERGLNVVLGDAENLPYKDRAFDVVIMQETLVHFLNPSKALGEAKRVLKKTGFLLGSTPHKNVQDFMWEDKRYHRNYYQEHELLDELRKHFVKNYVRVLKGGQFAVSWSEGFLADKPAELLFKCGGKNTKNWEEELQDRSILRAWFAGTQAPGTVYYRMAGFIEKMRKFDKTEIGFEEYDEENGVLPGTWQRKVSRNPQIPDRPISPVAVDHLEKLLRASDLSVWQIVQIKDAFAFLACAKEVVKKPIITEIDDWIFDLPPYNIAATPYQPNSDAEWTAYRQLELSDAVICSTNYIKVKLEDIFPEKRIFIVKNSLDFDIWDNIKPIEPWFKKKEAGRIRIGYTGCSNHEEDIEIVKKPILKLMQEFENVEFILPLQFKSWADSLGPRVFVNNRWAYIKDYPNMIAGWDMDIGIAPLRDNSFNSAKSNLRWLEYSALKIPSVVSSVIPFNETVKEGKTGFLADNQLDWYEKLKRLIQNEDLRKKVGQKAYEEVKKNFNMNDTAKYYRSVLQELKNEFTKSSARNR